MTEPATADHLLLILREHALELRERLGVREVQFSLPTDGKGFRIKVSVRRGMKSDLPRRIEFELDDRIIDVPLEISEDFQDYEPLLSGATRRIN
jgi:hypothetical protein